LNAFFGLALDNTTQLVILSSLLIGVFKFPADLVLGRMGPGTAAGVLVGDLVYTVLAIRLMRRTGRDDVTAMPFGIDTPSLFGIVFGCRAAPCSGRGRREEAGRWRWHRLTASARDSCWRWPTPRVRRASGASGGAGRASRRCS
jgi:hypothetical protein